MIRFRQITLLVLTLAGGTASSARGDGGTLRLNELAGPYRVALFTAPTPLRVGPVDVSVLVQDADTGQSLSDVAVEVTLTDLVSGNSLKARAQRGTATNKLFYAAELDLQVAGAWRIDVEITGPQGTEHFTCTVEAAEPIPRWQALWMWMAWPAVPIVLFGLLELRARTHGFHR
jgi:hypothetical protein